VLLILPGLKEGGEGFVLVGGDVVDAGFGGCGPADAGGFFGAEIVTAEPAVATELLLGFAVEGVKANPQIVGVGVADEHVEAGFFFGGPVASVGLPGGFDDVPTVVPPAVVVVGGIGREGFRRSGRILGIRTDGAEEEQTPADGNLIVEDGFLRVGFAGENEDGADIEGLEIADVGGARRGGEPVLVFGKQLPDGGEMLGLFGFEVEIESDERPIAVIPFPQSFLDDGADALEEIFAHVRLGAGGGSAVADERSHFACAGIALPEEVLFDGEGSAGGKRAVDAVGPPLEIGVAVVGVHKDAGAGSERGGGGCGRGEYGRRQEQDGKQGKMNAHKGLQDKGRGEPV